VGKTLLLPPLIRFVHGDFPCRLPIHFILADGSGMRTAVCNI
jgi:hypothetical protein